MGSVESLSAWGVRGGSVAGCRGPPGVPRVPRVHAEVGREARRASR